MRPLIDAPAASPNAPAIAAEATPAHPSVTAATTVASASPMATAGTVAPARVAAPMPSGRAGGKMRIATTATARAATGAKAGGSRALSLPHAPEGRDLHQQDHANRRHRERPMRDIARDHEAPFARDGRERGIGGVGKAVKVQRARHRHPSRHHQRRREQRREQLPRQQGEPGQQRAHEHAHLRVPAYGRGPWRRPRAAPRPGAPSAAGSPHAGARSPRSRLADPGFLERRHLVVDGGGGA